MEYVQEIAVYLAKLLAFRIKLFFVRWYQGGFLTIYGWWLQFVRACERRLAIRINVHFLFQPLYQEYNVFGYVLGFLYRFLKIVFGGMLYVFSACIACGVYVVWAAVPAVLVYRIIIPY